MKTDDIIVLAVVGVILLVKFVAIVAVAIYVRNKNKRNAELLEFQRQQMKRQADQSTTNP